MSAEQILQEAITNQKLICPECSKPVKQYEKFIEMIASVWDGPGDSRLETEGTKATLICGNCDWRERTEYWMSFIED